MANIEDGRRICNGVPLVHIVKRLLLLIIIQLQMYTHPKRCANSDHNIRRLFCCCCHVISDNIRGVNRLQDVLLTCNRN
jgi:hypothetical protein